MNDLTPSSPPARPQSISALAEDLPILHSDFASGELTQAKATALLEWLDTRPLVEKILPRLGVWSALRLWGTSDPSGVAMLGVSGAMVLALAGLSVAVSTGLFGIPGLESWGFFLWCPAVLMSFAAIGQIKDSPRLVAQIAAEGVVKARASALPLALQKALLASEETPDLVKDHLREIQPSPPLGASLVQVVEQDGNASDPGVVL